MTQIQYNWRGKLCEDRDTKQFGNVQTGTVIWVLHLPAQECWGLLTTITRSWNSQGGLVPRATGESMTLPPPWFQTSSLPNCERIHFFSLKPHVCGNMSTLGNEYAHSFLIFHISTLVFIILMPVLIIMFCFVFKYMFTSPSLCTSPGNLGPSVLWVLATCHASWLE